MLITTTRTLKSVNPIYGNGAFGNLVIDTDPFRCVTLENADTLIPANIVYDIDFLFSETFQQFMPHVIVPGRTAVEIHWANWVQDPNKPGPNKFLLDGCTALGQQSDFKADAIWNSKAAWIAFAHVISDQPSLKIIYKEDYGPIATV